MCLLGQVSDARLGRSQDRASGLDLAAGCHCGSDLHVVLGICFLESLHGPRHTLLTMSERHLLLLEVSVELRLSLSSIYFLLVTASHLVKPHVPGQKRLLHTDCNITALWDSEDKESGDLTLAMPYMRMDGILLPVTL